MVGTSEIDCRSRFRIENGFGSQYAFVHVLTQHPARLSTLASKRFSDRFFFI